MANPPGTNDQYSRNASSSSSRGPKPGNGNPVVWSSGTGLKHNPGISIDWSPEEQAILEEGLAKYSKETSIKRYAQIAMELPNKTIREVAMRCRWMTRKENSKRRKEDNLARTGKDKKERITDPSGQMSQHMAGRNIPPHATPTTDQGSISFKAQAIVNCLFLIGQFILQFLAAAIGGVTGELLEQNAQALNQISANLSTLKLQDNVRLLSKTRDNLHKLMNEMDKDVPELMKRMPKLPVKLNEELANTVLPPVKLNEEQVNAILSRQNLPKK